MRDEIAAQAVFPTPGSQAEKLNIMARWSKLLHATVLGHHNYGPTARLAITKLVTNDVVHCTDPDEK